MNLYEVCNLFASGTIIDISPELHAGTAVFPGDQSFSRKIAMQFSQGHHLDLSSIETTLHIGAHADAPSHYHTDGEPIHVRPINRYMGLTWVSDVVAACGDSAASHRVIWDDLSAETRAWVSEQARLKRPFRLLLKTGTFANPDQWVSKFASFDPSLIEALATAGCVLVGLDTPSVDPETSKDLPSHKMLFKNDLAVLEGIVLDKVQEGEFFLSALPIKIRDADAAPVRAVLFQLP